MDIPPAEIRQYKSLEADVARVKDIIGEHKVEVRSRTFPDSEYTGYDNWTLTIIQCKLEKEGCIINYMTVMDSKTSKIYMTIERPPYGLKAYAKRM